MIACALPQPRADLGQKHWHDGLAWASRQRWSDAVRAYGRATRAMPQDALYWVNLAHAQRQRGALPRAAAAATRALRLEPNNPLALRLLGDCLMQMHRYADAVAAFETLEAAGHEEPDAMLQHASVLQSLQRYGDAMTVLLRLLPLRPALVTAHALLADCCRHCGLKQEAVECMRTVLALEPDNLEALSRMCFEKRNTLDWSDLDADVSRMAEIIAALPNGAARMSASFTLLSLPMAPELHLAAMRAETQAICARVEPLPTVQPAQRAGQKLRLGLLSFDFCQHPVSQLLVEVLETIDRAQFELVLYSTGPDDRSALRARMQAVPDSFVDLRGMSNHQAAGRVRADGIDILIDLMGHTRGQRMPIFAYRPAPLQVGFLGYAGTNGADFIDYIISDPLVSPLALEAHYSEKIAQLPVTFQPNGRGRPLPVPGAYTRAQAGLAEDAFVMCAFNNTYKILPPAFDAWCNVLHALPHAVLWLKETNQQLHDNVLQAAADRGIAASRIVFAPNLPYGLHFTRLALADVFVDTWPYNAHTTAADALWAGVPVVTLYGNAYASRVAASVLNAAGLGELAFETVDDYCNAILALASDADLLAGYRHHLNSQRMALPLFDTRRYTRELESLLTRMAARWRAGLPAAHLPAEATPTPTPTRN